MIKPPEVAKRGLTAVSGQAVKLARITRAHAQDMSSQAVRAGSVARESVQTFTGNAGAAAGKRLSALGAEAANLGGAAKARAQAFTADAADFTQQHANQIKNGARVLAAGGAVAAVLGASVVGPGPAQPSSSPTPTPVPTQVVTPPPTPPPPTPTATATPKPAPTATPKPKPPPPKPAAPLNNSGNIWTWINEANAIQARRGVPARCTVPYDIYRIAEYESGFNPYAVNRTDSNWYAGHPSEGLMQTIPATFYGYAVRGYNQSPFIAPEDIMAAENYICAVYGSTANTPGIKSLNSGGPYKGY